MACRGWQVTIYATSRIEPIIKPLITQSAMRASRRRLPRVRFAAPAGACRPCPVSARKARVKQLAYTLVPRCVRRKPLRAAPLVRQRSTRIA